VSDQSGGINFDVNANFADFEAALDAAFAKIGPQLAKAIKAGFKEGLLGKKLTANIAKQIGKNLTGQVQDAVDESFRRNGGLGFEKAFAQEAKASKAYGQVFVDITQSIITNFTELAQAIAERSRAAKENVADIKVLQDRKIANQKIIEGERRLTAELKSQYKERSIAAEQESSLTRIAAQGSEQRRLARSQAFYRTLTAVASSGGREIASTIGKWARRFGDDESSANSKRILGFRRTNTEINNIEKQGSVFRLNLFNREARERAAAQRTQSLQTRTSTGVLGAATGQSALSGLLPVAGGLGFGAGLLKTLNVASDFTGAMAVLQVAINPTADQMKRLDKLAIDLGNDVKLPGVSAKDAADAFRVLSVSGVKVETTLGGAGKAVLALSRALDVDAETAAKAVSAGVNVFDIGAKDTVKVADSLALASIRSGSSASELADALQQAGFSFSKTFKKVDGGLQSFENMNAVLAAFAKNGIRGSDAGTSLKTAIQFLGGKSKEAKAFLSDLASKAGVTGSVLFDSAGKTRKFADVIKILRDGLNNFGTDEQKAEAISKIFGTDASRAAEVLKSLNENELKDFSAEVEKGGVAAKLAAAKNAGWRGGLDALSSSIETVAIAIGRVIGPAARRMAVFFSDLISNLSSGSGVWAVARAGLLGVAAGLAAIVAAKGSIEVLGLLRVGLRSLASPLGIAGLAIAGIGGALGILVAKSPEARSSLDQLKESVGGLLSDVGAKLGDKLSGVFETLERLAKSAIPILVDGLTTVASALSSLFGGAIEKGGEFAGTTLKAITAGLADVVSGFNGTAVASDGFFVKVGEAARKAVIVVTATVSVLVELIREGFSGKQTGTDFISKLFSGIGETAKDVIGIVQTFAANIGDAFSGTGSIVSKFGSLFSNLFDGIAPQVDDLFGGIPSKVIGFVRNEIIGPLTDYFRTFFGKDSSFAEGALRLINDVGQRLGRTITSILTNPTLLTVVGALFAGLAGVALSAVSGLISGVVEKLGDRLSEAIRKIPFFGSLLSGLGGFVSKFSGAITAALIAGFAFTLLKGPISKITEPIKAAVTGLRVAGASARGDTEKAAQILAGKQAANRANLDQSRLGAAIGGGVTGKVTAALVSPASAKAILNESSRLGYQMSQANAAGVTKGGGLITNAYKAILTGPGLKAVATAPFAAISAGVGKLKAALSTALGTIIPPELKRDAAAAGGSFVSGLTAPFAKIGPALGNAFGALRSGAAVAFQSVKDGAKSLVSSFTGEGGMQRAIAGVGAVAGGFFSGVNLASETTAGKVAGIAGAFTSIAVALSVGGPAGPILAAITVITTAIAFLKGTADADAAKMTEMTDAAQAFAKELLAAEKAGTTTEFIDKSAAERYLDLFGQFGDEINDTDKKAKGFKKSIEVAFRTAAETGDVTKAIAGISAALDGVRGDSVGVFNDFNGGLNSVKDRLKDTLAALKGVDLSNTTFGSKITFDFTQSGQESAEKAAKLIRDEIVREVSSGKIDARFLFDQISIEQVGDRFEIVRSKLEGVNQEMLTAIGKSITSVADGARTVATDSAGAFGRANSEIKDGNALLQAQLDLINKQPSAIDRITSKIQEQEAHLQRVKSAYMDTLDPGGVKSLADSMNNLAERGADAAKAIQENGGIIPKVGDVSDAARSVRSQLQPLTDAFKEGVAGILSTESDPAKAQQKIIALRDYIVGIAKKAVGGDGKIAAQIQEALNIAVPDLTTTVSILTDVTADKAKADAQQFFDYYKDQLKDKKIPLELEPFIGTNTPLGIALNALLGEGFTKTSTGGVKIPFFNKTVGGSSPGASPGPQIPFFNRPITTAAGQSPAPGAATAPPTIFGLTLGPIGVFGKAMKAASPELYARIAKLPIVGYTDAEKAKGSEKTAWDAVTQGKWSDLAFYMAVRKGRFPGFARGDIVNRPTLGVFGEAGPEVIVPLSRPDRMIELLSKALAMKGRAPAFADGAIFASNQRYQRSATPDGLAAEVRSLNAEIAKLNQLVTAGKLGQKREFNIVSENAASVYRDARLGEIEADHLFAAGGV